MGEQAKTSENRNMPAIILIVLGIVFLVVGVAIATIPGTHLRGSGIGTAAILLGVVLWVIAGLRLFYKRP